MSFENMRIFGYLLQTASQDFFYHVHQSLQPFNITPVQLGILQRLWQGEGITQKELATFLIKEQSNLAKMIDKLEQMDYIQRQAHPTDRRAHLIFLTQRGKEIEATMTEMLSQLNEQLLSGLTKEECAVFQKSLRTIISNSQKIAPNP
ncbi:Multiple antibiotic resistance protein MarR [compost metagenome]